MDVYDFVEPGETAVVLFLDDEVFYLDDDGEGSTATWPVDPSRDVDKVIIYRWSDDEERADIFAGNYEGARRAPDGRYRVYFSGMERVSWTGKPWEEFSQGSQYTLRYVHPAP